MRWYVRSTRTHRVRRQNTRAHMHTGLLPRALQVEELDALAAALESEAFDDEADAKGSEEAVEVAPDDISEA